MESSGALEQKLNDVRNRIKNACKAAKRPLDSVELLPVSKFQSIEKIEIFTKLGLKLFGENYAQELFEKSENYSELDINWVFIGQLQSNKIQRIVQVASEIQSAASLKHLRYINRYAELLGKSPFPVYLSVNYAQEPAKTGFAKDQIEAACREVDTKLPHIRLRGIMSLPPAEVSRMATAPANPETIPVIPEIYRELAAMAKTVGEGRLSLGMSADLEAAIHVGSNCVRIGTALFGKRS